MLQSLLDEGSWDAADLPGENGDAEPEAPEAEPVPDEPPEAEPAPDEPPELVEDEEEKEEEPAPVVPVTSEPVLEMLAAREGIRGPAADSDSEQGRDGGRATGDRRDARRLRRGGDRRSRCLRGSGRMGRRRQHGRGGAARQRHPALRPAARRSLRGSLPGRAAADLLLLDRLRVRQDHALPGARRACPDRLGAKTEWGSPRVFGVVRPARGLGRRSRPRSWATARSPGCPRTAPGSTASAGRCTRTSRGAVSSCSATGDRCAGSRSRSAGRATRRRWGRFSVTDKLRVTDPGSPYGCCVLALTGHQTDLPAELARRRPARRARHDGAVEPRARRRASAACA